jgi:hypothetical protein
MKSRSRSKSRSKSKTRSFQRRYPVDPFYRPPDISSIFLVHGEAARESFQVPPGLEIVTFVRKGQVLMDIDAQFIIRFLQQNHEKLAKRDLKVFHESVFKDPAIKSPIHLRSYGGGDACPNFTLGFEEPYLASQGFYNPAEAYFSVNYNCVAGTVIAINRGLDFTETRAFVTFGLHGKPINRFKMSDLARWLQSRKAKKTKRVYLLACQNLCPGVDESVDMELEADLKLSNLLKG